MSDAAALGGSSAQLAGPWLRGLRGLGQFLLRTLRRPWAVAAPALWAGAIWIASELTGGVDGPPALWLQFLGNGMHAFEFGVLALLCIPLLPRRESSAGLGEGAEVVLPWVRLTRGGIAGVLAGVSAYGVIDELHQARVPGRVSSPLDALTDLVGAACVLSVVHLAGQASATDARLRRRLALCLLACAAAAALSTSSDLRLEGVRG